MFFIFIYFILQDSHSINFLVSEVDVGSGSSWRERLVKWREIIEKDKFAEKKDSLRAKYVIDFDMEEVEKELRKEVSEKSGDSNGYRALWVSKRWWLYRPKLPYTYFLEKLHCSEVSLLQLYYFFFINLLSNTLHLE